MQGSYQTDMFRDRPLEDCRVFGAICSASRNLVTNFSFFSGYPTQLDKRFQSYGLRGRRCGVLA